MAILRLGALALVAACGPTSSSGGGAAPHSVCDTDPRAMSYAVGLSQSATGGGAVKVRFVDAMPAPPSKGLNTWTIAVTDGSGAPVTGATITVKPFMPDHGHGSSITPRVMPMTAEGTYQVTLLDFFMPGIWQNTLTITTPSGPVETVVFTFCIDG
jgi:YtkA-like